MRPRLLFFVLLCGLAFTARAQTRPDTAGMVLREVVVTAFKEEHHRESPLNIVPVRLDSLRRLGTFTLTDALARVPGVQMLSTGLGISKPVIRGLYGNRVLVLLSGLKFDNQQWQEEHGMGLSDLGLARVELIKGPLSVLYGSEALGGVINLIEEDKPAAGQQQTDVGLKVHSNTLGGQLQGGYKANYGKRWLRIRAGFDSHGDYSNGLGQRVLNSRFDGYYLKGSYGFERGRWTSTNHLLSSFNRFGFIFNDVYDFIEPDARWSRSFSNPAHLVLLNVLSSENKWELAHSKLQLNAGVQSNKRMENEGSGQISLDMHLLTAQYLLRWEKPLSPKTRLIISNLGSFEDNTNYGMRKIVPDARMEEGNLGLYLENYLGKFVLENGVGAGGKRVKTFFTPTVNSPEKDIQPFTRSNSYYNALSGISFLPNQVLNLKANVATGVRVPNLAELSSNGLHEGVFTYEIGNPDMRNERNVCGNLYANVTSRYLDLSGSLFYNRFYNFIYLAPTTEEWFGFPVYRFLQQDAFQQGGELSLALRPFGSGLQLNSTFAQMTSKTDDGHYTPFLPAPKLTGGLSYARGLSGSSYFRNVSVFTEWQHYYAQNRTAPEEKATPAYTLWNAGISLSAVSAHGPVDISLTGNNLLNKAYYDHLSRLKNFNLLNIGRNVTLQVRYYFNQSLKKASPTTQP